MVLANCFISFFISGPQVYMVLANGCIYYFNNDYSKAPHGKFSLYGYSSVKRDKSISVKQAPFPFRIEHSNPEFKTYIFATSSEKEMKEWMKYIKGQMVTANGQTAENYYYTYRKAGKIIKQAAEDDKSLTYQDIETDIYATGTFTPSTDYSAKFGVKLQNEDSDDDELQKVPAPPPRKPKKQGKEGVRDPRDRPPQPIPGQEAPPTYAAPKLPSRNKDKKTDPDKPEIPPRDQTHSSTLERETDPFGELQEGEFYLKKDGPHEHSIEMLLYVYHTETLPTAEVMLTTPYKLHPKYKPVES
ncbi:hypothetical protein FSP39_013388 [Pinctada imbricata]|uniref:PH domain-containing protein n=1 Tax=Pinctada imbricata TaxID=66713 RepID=A0AA88Y3U4_PINIB|nr:hypothetical protein FSP39_013388 [Pinctada imbricata]